LDPFSQAALALAFHELGESEQAEEVLDVLNEHAIYIGEHVYWAQPTHDGQYNRKTMASTLRTTALILDAYVAIRPDSELIPGMANYLFAERKPSFGWGTTNETSFAILALTDYFILQEQASGQAPVKVDLNGNLLGSGILAPGQATIRYEIPADQLTTGLNSLALTAAGDAEVFYDLSIRFSLPKNQIEPAGNLTILRQYLDPVTSHPLEFIVPGQLVKIVLSVSWSSGDQFFMLVEDHLPGGLEALNENLNTTSYVGDDEYFKNWMWNEYGYNYKEIRDNSVTFFITRLTGRTRVFRYLARATIAGEFTALPAEAYAMYDPKVWGRSASDRIVILTPEEVEVVLHSQSTPIPTNDLPVDEAVPVLP